MHSSLPNASFLFSEGAEKAVLSNIFYDYDKLEQALLYLKPSDFYGKTHGLIFAAMVSLYEKRENIDPIAVFEEISRQVFKAEVLRDENDLINLSEYLDTLSFYLPADKTIELYLRIIKEHSIRRNILKVSKEMIDFSNDANKNLEELVEDIQKKVLSIEIDYSSKNLCHIKLVSERVHSEIYERSQTKKQADFGIPSGFATMDSLIGGFKNSDFIIVGARPSIGKTAFALNIASNIALKENKRKSVGFFSLEMTADTLVKRIISSQGNLDSFKVQNGVLTGSEIKILNKVVSDINESEFYIEDTPNISLLTLTAQARKMKRFHSVDIIFIDYISLISLETKNLPRHEQVASISKSLKELARELSVPILALSQLTRDTEGREPNIATLRESGALEQDADLVILLHREREKEYRGIKLGNRQDIIETKVIVAKHRNGPTGRAEIVFLPHIIKFANKESYIK